LLLFLRERDFEGWVACLDMTASLAFGAVIKQQALAPLNTGNGAA